MAELWLYVVPDMGMMRQKHLPSIGWHSVQLLGAAGGQSPGRSSCCCATAGCLRRATACCLMALQREGEGQATAMLANLHIRCIVPQFAL